MVKCAKFIITVEPVNNKHFIWDGYFVLRQEAVLFSEVKIDLLQRKGSRIVFFVGKLEEIPL